MKFKQSWTKQKKVVLLLAVTGIVVAAAAGWLWRLNSLQSAGSAQYETYEVKTGDISLMASGTAQLVAGQSADLSFPVSGVVSQLNVAVGDQVKSGDILAVLDGDEELQLQISQQQLAVNAAQSTLDALTGNPDDIIAQAQLALATAQETYTEAKKNLHTEDQMRCLPELTGAYYKQYEEQVEEAIPWEKERDNPDTIYGWQYIMQHLYAIYAKRDKLYDNYLYCQGYTEQEIIDSQSALLTAEADLAQAQSHYDTVSANNGVDQEAIDLAQATLDNAQAQLALAQEQLSKLVLTAPIDGTVTALNGEVGDEVSTATFVTLVDLENPEVTINMDEIDLENIAVGCDASVEFSSISGRTFSGTVTAISPVMANGFGYTTVFGDVQLDTVNLGEGQRLPIGLSGTVDVTCESRTGVPLVSLEALHTLDDGRTVAYVLTDSGQVEERQVETGVQNYTLAEVVSGLNVGEKVITSGLEISG